MTAADDPEAAEAELRRTERLGGGGLVSKREISGRKLDHDLRKAELSAAYIVGRTRSMDSLLEEFDARQPERVELIR